MTVKSTSRRLSDAVSLAVMPKNPLQATVSFEEPFINREYGREEPKNRRTDLILISGGRRASMVAALTKIKSFVSQLNLFFKFLETAPLHVNHSTVEQRCEAPGLFLDFREFNNSFNGRRRFLLHPRKRTVRVWIVRAKSRWSMYF